MGNGIPTTPPSAVEGWGKQPDQAQPQATPMLDAVTSDLAKLNVDLVPGGYTYKATALWLARVIDKRGDDEGPSQTAKLAEQLTKVMLLLTGKGEGDDNADFRRFAESLSEPSMG